MKTTKVQLDRIRILIEELEKLRKDNPKGKFNMGIWCDLEFARTKTKLQKQIMEATKNPCGTAACLAGKAGLMPRFRRMGFKWTAHSSGYADFSYKGNLGDDAVKAFFGYDVFTDVFLNTNEIKTLFQGINALRQFVEDEDLMLPVADAAT